MTLTGSNFKEMAILNSIRKRGFFLILIIALALFAFILSDIITKGTGGGGDVQNVVATINGKELSREDFMGKVENQQRAMGPNSNTAQAMTQVWDRELRSVLLQQQVEELGIGVGEEQINEQLSLVLANNPTFQDENGLYSEAKMVEYVASIQGNDPQSRQQMQLWNDFIENTRESLLQNNYLNMVRGGLVSTIADGEQQYKFENDKINIQYVHVPFTSIADEDVTVSESEIAAYIQANPKQFEVDPMVDIQYVTFLEEPSAADDIAKREAMNGLIESFTNATELESFISTNSDNDYVDRWMVSSALPASLKDTILNIPEGVVYGPYKDNGAYNISKVVASRQMPDSVKARHILVPIGLSRTDSITRTPDQAKILADSIMGVVKQNRSKFGAMVTQFSSDAGSIEKGGRYDWYAYNRMVGPFRDFTFEGKTGDIGVVETQFGYHIIEIEGQKDMSKAVKIATVSQEIEASEATLTEVFSKAAKFEEQARSGDFNAIATEGELQTRPVNRIGALDANIPGIGNNRSIVNWAFEEGSTVGDVKRFDVGETYVIAQLTRKSTKKALQSVAEASAVVTPILRNKKKAEKIRQGITGTSVQEVASSQSVAVKSANALTRSNPTIAGAGTEPAVVGAAFGKAAGESTGLIDGETGVFMVRVTAVNEAPALDNYTSYINTLNTAASGAINTNVFNALKKAADIEDNRASFY